MILEISLNLIFDTSVNINYKCITELIYKTKNIDITLNFDLFIEASSLIYNFNTLLLKSTNKKCKLKNNNLKSI